MGDKTYNVLFLCTQNAGRSILAEALLNSLGAGRFKAYSGGSFPAGAIDTHAVAVLEKLRIDTNGLRSKSWDEFASPDAPHMDFVITLCDHAAEEICPVWPGHPITAHWGYPDPAKAEGDEAAKLAAFSHTASLIAERLRLLINLPVDKLEHLALQSEVEKLAA
ncbi:MAG: arsenate reductase ArsC [Burkholderiales bacterium]|nr:arsenate reductase ArsC [Burkholderiales bacterium]